MSKISYHTWIISPEVVAIPTKIPESWIVLLFYNRMWEIPISFPREQVPENLLITTDKKYFERANVVVFHLPTLKFNLDDDLEKFPNQRWVGWTMECEENYPFIKNIDFMSLFDYWMTYHQGADVVQPYYEASFPKHLQKVVPLPFETKSDVCMFVSSMINQSKRQEYLLELMKYLPIDSYGKLFNNRMLKNDNGKSSKMELYRQYKFVIAFENVV